MRLDHIAVPLRSSGLTVVETSGWRTRGSRGRDLTAVRGVMWHHTATAQRPGADIPTLRILRDGHATLSGPLCHIGLGRSGAVYLIAAGRANHAGVGRWPGLVGNDDTIGIEAESSGIRDDWTDEQRVVMPLLGAALSRIFDLPPARHVGHKEWAPTRKIDPAFVSMPRLRADIAALLTGAAQPPPAPDPEDDMPTAAEVAQELAKLLPTKAEIAAEVVQQWGDLDPIAGDDSPNQRRTLVGIDRNIRGLKAAVGEIAATLPGLPQETAVKVADYLKDQPVEDDQAVQL